MSDLLNNGSNSLLAFQRALSTTSHNIANLNTEGYSRQRVDLEAVNPSKTTNGFIGNGVRAAGIERLHDQFAMSQILQSTSAHSQHDTHRMLASRIDNLVADDALSLTPVLNDFFNAIQDVNSNPTSSAAREVFAGSTEGVASRLRSLQGQLDSTQEEVTQRTNIAINEVNQLATEVAELNQRILSAGSRSRGTEPNDLLDKRDSLISKLSEYVDVSRLEQDDGSVNVFMGNGVGLVVGNRASELRTTANSLSSDQSKIEVSHGNTWQNVSSRLTGGTIGGLLEFESQTLSPSMNELGLIALQFANAMNTQNAQGLDLNGQPGSNMFSVAEPIVMANDQNAGSATISSTFSDISQVQGSEYDVRYTGSDFTITRLSDQTQISSNMPLTLDGMQISLAGAPAVGDTFRISPTRRVAATMQSVLNGADALALSSPLHSSGNIGNLSDATVSDPLVNDINNAALRDEIDIRFITGTSFDIVDSTSGTVISAGVTYTPNTAISHNGWQVDVNGTPQAGDEFSVLPNNSVQGNNTNGLALAAMQLSPEMSGEKTFNEGYSTLVSRVGGQTRSLQTRSDALNTMRLDAIDRQQSVSGVNLDEEAINLTRFEQAYQASAQIIATADTLFQTVLGVVGR